MLCELGDIVVGNADPKPVLDMEAGEYDDVPSIESDKSMVLKNKKSAENTTNRFVLEPVNTFYKRDKNCLQATTERNFSPDIIIKEKKVDDKPTQETKDEWETRLKNAGVALRNRDHEDRDVFLLHVQSALSKTWRPLDENRAFLAANVFLVLNAIYIVWIGWCDDYYHHPWSGNIVLLLTSLAYFLLRSGVICNKS